MHVCVEKLNLCSFLLPANNFLPLMVTFVFSPAWSLCSVVSGLDLYNLESVCNPFFSLFHFPPTLFHPFISFCPLSHPHPRARMRKGRTQRRTVVRGAGRSQVLLERLDDVQEGSRPRDLQQHLHQLIHSYCKEEGEEEEERKD